MQARTYFAALLRCEMHNPARDFVHSRPLVEYRALMSAYRIGDWTKTAKCMSIVNDPSNVQPDSIENETFTLRGYFDPCKGIVRSTFSALIAQCSYPTQITLEHLQPRFTPSRCFVMSITAKNKVRSSRADRPYLIGCI